MRLKHGLHLAYCTNIHRGEGWDETFAALREHTLRVKQRVSPDAPYAIGLRLGQDAATELMQGERLTEFKQWLQQEDCYVFTINGFPYGSFHGTRVKEQVYRPDWTEASRVDYTNLLFDILVELLPEGVAGSVSTLPGSFKEFITDDAAQGDAIIANLAKCCQHIAGLRERTGMDLHLGLEPEPLGWFETSAETVAFFERFRAAQGSAFDEILGVNYDTCHLAVEYETAADALGALRDAGIKISKLHLSSALRLAPEPVLLNQIESYQENVYLHQVVARTGDKPLVRFRDLPDALGSAQALAADEWRVHFHVPLHAEPADGLLSTSDHIIGVLDLLQADPSLCEHLEMETYTWEVLPDELASESVVDQLESEYRWTLAAMEARSLR